MSMKVHLYATFRAVAGASELDWQRPAATLGVLIHDLCEHYGGQFRRWMCDGDKLGAWVILLVNGCDARHLQGLDTPLHPEDVISIFPPVAGGSQSMQPSWLFPF